MFDLARKRRQRGFSILEVLVSMVIVSVGLLGLAALQSVAQQTEYESYQRAQALLILSDIVSRLGANKGARRCYDVTTDETNGTPFIGTGDYAATYTCTAWGTAASQARAITDLQEVEALLLGETETLNSANVGAMVGARACIAYNDAYTGGGEQFTVTVAWAGLSATWEPPVACANGEYTNPVTPGTNDDYVRRVVSTVVTFGI